MLCIHISLSFFFKQKEKKSLNPPFPSTAGGECVGVLWNIIDIHPASAPASRFAIPTPSPLSIPCSPPQKGTLCHHHYGSVKMPRFSMTYPILRPRSVWTTFMQGYKWEGGGEGVASGEGGSGLGGLLENGDHFCPFFERKTKTNLSFNGSKDKQKRKSETNKQIKNPIPKDFFSSTQVALFPVTF